MSARELSSPALDCLLAGVMLIYKMISVVNPRFGMNRFWAINEREADKRRLERKGEIIRTASLPFHDDDDDDDNSNRWAFRQAKVLQIKETRTERMRKKVSKQDRGNQRSSFYGQNDRFNKVSNCAPPRRRTNKKEFGQQSQGTVR